MDDRPQKSRKVWLILVALGLVALGAGLFFLIEKYLLTGTGEPNEQVVVHPTPTLTPTPTITPTPTLSPTPTSNPASSYFLNKARSVAGKFMDARLERNLAAAKPYMTTSCYNSSNQEGFAGTSSPSMGEYDITSAKYLSAADLYEVKVKTHWFLQGEESGTETWTLQLVYKNGKMLVNDF